MVKKKSKEEFASGLSVTAMTLAVLSIFLGWIPIVGWGLLLAALVLSIVALSSSENGSRSKALSLASLIISIIMLVLIVSAIIAFAAFATSSNVHESIIEAVEENISNEASETGSVEVNESDKASEETIEIDEVSVNNT